eukprot:scaffold8740_cov113-Cylindrotheca_fusiformis.AAC.3
MNGTRRTEVSSIRDRRRSRRGESAEVSRLPSQRFRTFRQAAWLFVWVALGLVSYGGAWLTLMTGEDRSYAAVASLNLQMEHSHQLAQELRSTKRIQQKQERMKESSGKEKEERKRRLDKEHRWVAIALWATVVTLSYYRITRNSRDRRAASSNDNPRQQMLILQNRRIHREVIVRTLRRINRERRARQEELISLEAIEAFQRALMEDREVWRGLAAQDPQSRNRNRGVTPQQMEACPQRSPHEDDTGDCPICLTCLYHPNSTLRSLPCNHSYHSDCIDRWLEKSTFCPVCKFSLEDV